LASLPERLEVLVSRNAWASGTGTVAAEFFGRLLLVEVQPAAV
jgi:hypothetical protein